MPAVSKYKATQLTDRERNLANLVLQGMPAVDAFPRAGYRDNGALNNRKLAYAVLQRPRVIDYMEQQRAAANTNATLSVEQKRQYLAGITRANPEDPDLDRQYVQAMRQLGPGGPIVPVIPDKLRAIELDNKLAGHGQPDTQINIQNNLAVSLADFGKKMSEEFGL